MSAFGHEPTAFGRNLLRALSTCFGEFLLDNAALRYRARQPQEDNLPSPVAKKQHEDDGRIKL